MGEEVMTETAQPEASTPPPRTRWREWFQLAALALILLMLSEALWLWQTWPVRELLQPSAPAAPRANSR
jgi:hypothetical protein